MVEQEKTLRFSNMKAVSTHQFSQCMNQVPSQYLPEVLWMGVL